MKEVSTPKPSTMARLFRIESPYWFKFSRGVGDRSQRLTYRDDELLVSLRNSVKLHEHAVRESETLWGRMTGVFIGPTDPGTIEIDGTRLHQLFALAESKPPAEIDINKTYALDLTRFRALLTTATENLQKHKN